MKNRLLYILLLSFLSIASIRIVNLAVFKRQAYMEEYDKITNTYIKGASAPRGRILDVNGKVLVDSKGVNTLLYNRTEGSSEKQEVSVAYSLGKVLKYNDNLFTKSKMKMFYLATHNNGENLITDEERTLYKERKLSKSDIESLKLERITDEILDEFSLEDKNAGYIYYLLKNGYYYENKVIKKNLTDEEVVLINDLDLPGVKIELVWERTYPYNEVLRTILGSVSNNGVPLEYKDYYEEKGISLDSTVGISGLEFEYDEYLRGTDAIYKLIDGKLELSEEETRGADLYLSIDIAKQLEIESILKSEMLNAKKMNNTKYFNHSYALVGDPNTGEIIAASGLQLNKDHFVDITINMIGSSYTVGSIVKGATISVGYDQGIIKPGYKVKDACVKVYGSQEKCSWTSLGVVDDIRALEQSSNYYQFLIAARLANPNYKWNSKLNATKEHFDIYRTMLASYGLGVKTGVDLPNERIGIIGKTIKDDLLLNLSIGQYDTYTPVEILQYINTIANGGSRIAPTLMKKIVKDDEVILERKSEILNKIEIDQEYINRIQQGFKAVMERGTGKNYVNGISSAGKTGTSETFIDTNGNGLIDTRTTSTSFIMYAPFESPKYSIVILSPNLSTGGHRYAFNLRVNQKITELLFEIPE